MKLAMPLLVLSLTILSISLASAAEQPPNGMKTHTQKLIKTHQMKSWTVIQPHMDELLIPVRKAPEPLQDPALGADFSKVREFGGEDIGE